MSVREIEMKAEYLNEAGLDAWLKAFRSYLSQTYAMDAQANAAWDQLLTLGPEAKKALFTVVVAILDAGAEQSFEEWRDDINFD